MSGKDGGPAFPIYPRHDGIASRELKDAIGMSLRDYFAAQSISSVRLSFDSKRLIDVAEKLGKTIPALIAETAYEAADAMLAAREEKS